MSFKKTLLIGLGIVVGAVSLDNYISGNVYADGDKAEQKQGEVTKNLEEKALFGDKEPDERLEDIINSLDPKKAEELNTNKKCGEVINILKDTLEETLMYKLDSLEKEKKEKFAYAFSELGSALYYQKKFDQSNRYKKIAVLLDPKELYLRNWGLGLKEKAKDLITKGKKEEARKYFNESEDVYRRCLKLYPDGKYAEQNRKTIEEIIPKYRAQIQ